MSLIIPREIEVNIAAAWIQSGALTVTDYGEENTYYKDEFDRTYFCKNYPNYGQEVTA